MSYKLKRYYYLGSLLLVITILTATGAFFFLKNNNSAKKANKQTPKEEKKTEILICDKAPNEELNSSLKKWAQGENLNNKKVKYIVKDDWENDDSCIARIYSTNPGELLYRNLLIPVVRFDAMQEDITKESFEETLNSQKYQGEDLLFSEKAARDLGLDNSHSRKIDDIYAEFHANSSTIAIISFEELNPYVKVLKIDGQSPLYKGFEADNYELSTSYYISTESKDLSEEIQKQIKTDKLGNYDPSKITQLMITGTSLVGVRTAWFDIRRHGDNLYPARTIAETLRAADLTHLSNESPFSDSCGQEKETVVFCADKTSFEQIPFVGADVVNLASNHILDWGEEDFLGTLQMYKDAGIQYYGGGQDLDEAHKPAIVERNGLKFGFLGYNLTPPFEYTAAENKPGSAYADETQMKADIEKLRPQVDYIFVDMQWWQEYEPNPDTTQQETGRELLDWGADFVNGVQAHAVQGIEYHDGKIIFYGMGNLIFDQRAWEETRRGVMVQHFFYEDKYLGYYLIPTYIPLDLNVQFANEEQRQITLETIYQNSR